MPAMGKNQPDLPASPTACMDDLPPSVQVLIPPEMGSMVIVQGGTLPTHTAMQLILEQVTYFAGTPRSSHPVPSPPAANLAFSPYYHDMLRARFGVVLIY